MIMLRFPYELNSFYYALNENKISLLDWMKNLTETALLLLLLESADSLVVFVDDTLMEKFVEKFAHGANSTTTPRMMAPIISTDTISSVLCSPFRSERPKSIFLSQQLIVCG